MKKHSIRRWLVVAAAFLTPTLVLAQAAVTPLRADPSDPRAAVPAATHQSALARYRPAADEQPADWKAANDTVTQVGGWRTYARESSAPEPAPASASASTPPPATQRAPAAAAPASQPASSPARGLPGHGGTH